jgi:acetolactate synthase regulatory subunit
MKPDDTHPKSDNDKVEIRVQVPRSLGLTDDQIRDLKEKVRVEIVSTTITGRIPQQIVVQTVDDSNIF